jgi:hypothetical protein
MKNNSINFKSYYVCDECLSAGIENPDPAKPLYIRERQANGKYQYVWMGGVMCKKHGFSCGQRWRHVKKSA